MNTGPQFDHTFMNSSGGSYYLIIYLFIYLLYFLLFVIVVAIVLVISLYLVCLPHLLILSDILVTLIFPNTFFFSFRFCF